MLLVFYFLWIITSLFFCICYNVNCKTRGGDCMKKGKLLNIALSIAFINILFVCFSIINVNAEEDTDTLNTNDESTVMESGWTNKENQWYYYDHGEKKTGWLHTDYWYYLDQDGKMVTG